MAHFKNPATRKIGKHTYHLSGEGLQKKYANLRAKQLRNVGILARVIPDERLGRYDMKNHDVVYCVYATKKPTMIIDNYPGGGKKRLTRKA